MHSRSLGEGDSAFCKRACTTSTGAPPPPRSARSARLSRGPSSRCSSGSSLEEIHHLKGTNPKERKHDASVSFGATRRSWSWSRLRFMTIMTVRCASDFLRSAVRCRYQGTSHRLHSFTMDWGYLMYLVHLPFCVHLAGVGSIALPAVMVITLAFACIYLSYLRNGYLRSP